MLIFLLLFFQTHQQWVTFTTFHGYVPSYTYPVNLNAGDRITGFLTWQGLDDLDIYLYQDGMDLLNRNIWIAKRYSPNLNP